MSDVIDGAAGRPRFRVNLLLTLALAAMVMAGLSLIMTSYYDRYREARLRAQTSLVAASAATTLGNAVNQRLAMVRGLAAFATVKSGEDPRELEAEFPTFAHSYIEQVKGIRNISLGPDFIVRNVYPTDPANLKVLGNNLLEDKRPGFADAVRRAVVTKGLAVHEPVPLIQGGLGLIARHAVFVQDRPWGAVGMVFTVDSLIEEAGIDQIPGYSWALRTSTGRDVAGTPQVFGQDPAITRVALAEGYWELAMIPRNGWAEALDEGPERVILRGALLLFSVIALGVIADRLMRKERLERLVEQRTAELTAANQELERFAFITAHDLQEPLRAIMTLSQLAERSLKDEPARTADLLGQLSGRAQHMRSLVLDVQSYLGESHFPLPTERASADEALKGALNALRDRLAQAPATVNAQPLPQVMADGPRLTEIFRILLENAVEYRLDDRPLVVDISGTRQNGFCVFEVRDNGVGIEESYHERIFEVFQRLHNRTTHPGNGMGLALATKMVRRLGGTIQVSSTPGEGSTFTVRLPA